MQGSFAGEQLFRARWFAFPSLAKPIFCFSAVFLYSKNKADFMLDSPATYETSQMLK